MKGRGASAAGQGSDDVYDALFLEGAYLAQVAYRAEHFLGTRAEIAVTFPMTVFLFLLGVRLYRAGAFDDNGTGRRIRGRMLAWGFGLGLPLNLLGASLVVLDSASRYVFPMVLMLGYVGLVGWLLDHARRRGPVTLGLRAVGRTALTCYVLQNVIASWLFYGWGLGLAARVDGTTWIFGAWAGIGLFLVLASLAWLSRFERGPLEALGARLLALVPDRRATATDRAA
ncbi:uncharacterized protein DUF418 [Nocardiopsis sp. Huas11]|uniref:DUF418 domain-containing protein n=1 Tax=Nocardiopsis sp. Huas11 TaxID=2183912 RepID=UPI000F25DCCA|nr:DUF418 domain-containing protein [Nocardiopsis sp. Huas11]RKS06745.1 uncharacterized protein DUF418 [Nocardiopsis sp. Huas11]